MFPMVHTSIYFFNLLMRKVFQNMSTLTAIADRIDLKKKSRNKGHLLVLAGRHPLLLEIDTTPAVPLSEAALEAANHNYSTGQLSSGSLFSQQVLVKATILLPFAK